MARIGPDGAGRTRGERGAPGHSGTGHVRTGHVRTGHVRTGHVRTGHVRTGHVGTGRQDWRRPLLPGRGPLARVHPALVFVVVLVVFAVGAWWGGPAGALLLGVLALAVAGLLVLTWPRLSASDRAVRILVLAVLIAIALQRWA